MENVYVVIDYRDGSKALAVDYAFNSFESAEIYAEALRQFLHVRAPIIEVISLPVGNYHKLPS